VFTREIRTAEEELRSVPPHRVAFLSFTNRAVDVAAGRARRLLGRPQSSFPYFRTLHSLAFSQTGCQRVNVITADHAEELTKILGARVTGKTDPGEPGLSEGDLMIHMDQLARSTKKPLRRVWEETRNSVPWISLERASAMLKKYKEERSLVDFTDMIERFAAGGDPLPIDVAILDEAQDFTPLQWDAVDLATRNAKRVYVAGDDDQAIYGWAGADVDHFLSLGEDARKILPSSHRLPRKIFRLSQKILSTISKRYEKKWAARDEEGEVIWESDLRQVSFGEGSWLLLSRNVAFLHRLEEHCRTQGMPFIGRKGRSSIVADEVRAIEIYEKWRRGEKFSGKELGVVADQFVSFPSLKEDNLYSIADALKKDPGVWHDVMNGIPSSRRSYYLEARRRGEKMLAPPRVQVSTIHGAKGGEADNVVLLLDLTEATEENAWRNRDEEARTFYVGTTRARKKLFLIRSSSSREYKIMQ
jgi:hypothetical protein